MEIRIKSVDQRMPLRNQVAMPVKAASVVLCSGLFIGACSFQDAGQQPSELTNEISDEGPALDLTIGLPEITPGQILGEECVYDRGCQWEQFPSLAYPSFAGVGEASCDVWLTVGEDGRAHDVSVDCDDPRFNRATEIGLSTLKHSVEDSCGRPCSVIGRHIPYPIEYRFED